MPPDSPLKPAEELWEHEDGHWAIRPIRTATSYLWTETGWAQVAFSLDGKDWVIEPGYRGREPQVRFVIAALRGHRHERP